MDPLEMDPCGAERSSSRVDKNIERSSTRLTFAAVGELYIGVEQLVQKQRLKRDFKGRSIPTAIPAGSALAFTSAVLDIGGQTTRFDNGKECFTLYHREEVYC